MKYRIIYFTIVAMVLTGYAQAANGLVHTADQNADHVINLTELLRVIQLFNSDGLHCEDGTEDGFAPGLGDQSCAPHNSDYALSDWTISLSELLRLIQFYNVAGYHAECGTEDGFAPEPGENNPCENGNLVKQPVQDFSYRNDIGDRRYYTTIQTDNGIISGGPSATAAWENGALHIVTETVDAASSYCGNWISMNETADSRHLLLDPNAALPWPIKPDCQVKIKSWYAVVKGHGDWKIEFKTGPKEDEILVQQWLISNFNQNDYVEIRRDIPEGIQPFKLLNFVAETNSDLFVDEIGFYVSVPEMSKLRYAFLASASQVFRCYGIDNESGLHLVRDRSNWPIGDFDSVPGLGFVAMVTACGRWLDMIEPQDAETLVAECVQSLLAMPAHESGFYPHWTKSQDGQVIRHPDSEISTVDTALALVSMFFACDMLAMSEEKAQILDRIRSLDFAAVTNGGNAISHGFDASGNLIPYAWTEWGGETQIIVLLAKLNDLTKNYSYQTVPPSLPAPPVNGGTGFIAELAGLFFSCFGGQDIGPDGYGVNWFQQRLNVLAAQIGLLNPPIFIGGHSAVEIVSTDGFTIYHVGKTNPSHTGEDGFGFPWFAPHYAAMISALDILAANARVDYMINNGLMYPLCGPAESVLFNSDDWSIVRWNPMQGVLNGFFSAIGYYHTVAAEEGLQDKVFFINESDSDLEAAMESLFSGPPAPQTLQAENGYGQGSIKQRGNAQGLQTVWLLAGETRSIDFSTTASANMTVSVRYSNDNYGPMEEIDLALDSRPVGSFTTEDTGDYGYGWNIFVQSPVMGSVAIGAGNHTITVTAREGTGDGYGVEIDSVTLEFAQIKSE
ncbi:MAG TPA: hypothetical protein PLI09_11640 [Candidatus Hydrogenedentes bacterium]|nr:hypothetical protein [Candidatus Hydrogenedentota bacterium]